MKLAKVILSTCLFATVSQSALAVDDGFVTVLPAVPSSNSDPKILSERAAFDASVKAKNNAFKLQFDYLSRLTIAQVLLMHPRAKRLGSFDLKTMQDTNNLTYIDSPDQEAARLADPKTKFVFESASFTCTAQTSVGYDETKSWHPSLGFISLDCVIPETGVTVFTSRIELQLEDKSAGEFVIRPFHGAQQEFHVFTPKRDKNGRIYAYKMVTTINGRISEWWNKSAF